jgi:hypothetical protein
MRKAIFLVALIIFAAAQAKATACPTDTAATYAALYGNGPGATSCTINNNWTLSKFMFTDITTVGSPTASQLLITPLSGSGVGFSGTPTVPFASGSSSADVELQYVISFTGAITSLSQSITGTVGAGGFDNILDDYCPGGTTVPPASGAFCTAGAGVLTTNLFASGTASSTVTFAGVNSVAVLKDVSANSAAADTVTSFINCFNGTCSSSTPPPPVAEPGALLMLGSGLLGLALVSLRKKQLV